ncbi:MAG: hypothetical protein ACLGHA_10290 [Gammaproteobacteria bacterium]
MDRPTLMTKWTPSPLARILPGLLARLEKRVSPLPKARLHA